MNATSLLHVKGKLSFHVSWKIRQMLCSWGNAQGQALWEEAGQAKRTGTKANCYELLSYLHKWNLKLQLAGVCWTYKGAHFESLSMVAFAFAMEKLFSGGFYSVWGGVSHPQLPYTSQWNLSLSEIIALAGSCRKVSMELSKLVQEEQCFHLSGSWLWKKTGFLLRYHSGHMIF